MTLHDAITDVLKVRGCLSAAQVAKEINRQRLYVRGDRCPLPTSQISARVAKHPDLFVRDTGKIFLRAAMPSVQGSLKETPELASEHTGTSAGSSPDDVILRSLGTVGNLITRGLPKDTWLGCCGVYRITVPRGYVPKFINSGDAIATGNVISPWSTARLKAKWVRDTDTVYIGIAGRHTARSLRKRLRELLRHASGHTSDRGPHNGGEILWQLRDYAEFEVSAAPTGDPPIPRSIEVGLLEQFFDYHRALPFANRQR